MEGRHEPAAEEKAGEALGPVTSAERPRASRPQARPLRSHTAPRAAPAGNGVTRFDELDLSF